MAAFYLLDKIEPFHQPFSLKNYTLMYPYADPERVPIPLAMAIVVLGPIIVIAIYTMVVDGLFATVGGSFKKYTFKSRLWELNCGVLGLLLGVGSSFVITAALKNAIGKPRPDIIARCQMPSEVSAPFLEPANFTLATWELCVQPDHAKLKDGFRSFPSGHSSSKYTSVSAFAALMLTTDIGAWAGLFYLSLYLTGKLHILDSRGEVWKTFVALVPSLGAALIAGSRIMDARHHPFDVITGSMLGIACAWAAYRQYFPPLHDFRAKGRAYPIRTWGKLSEERQEERGMDTVPLKADAAGMGYEREGSPEGSTTNHFRDEMARRRRADAPPPTYTTSGMPHQRRQRNEWDDSSDEEQRDVEMQPRYPAPQQRYDPSTTRLAGQETSYASYKPPPAEAQNRPSADVAGAAHSRTQLTETYANT